MNVTQPLKREQQLFLQRVMASHVLSHTDAQTLFEELKVPNASLEDAFREINAQLSVGFGLEIASVVWNNKSKGDAPTQYHAVINTHADDVAKSSFAHHFSQHEFALMRLILERLTQPNDDDNDDNNSDEDGSATSTPKGGGAGSTAPRKDLINLRGNLVEPYKLTLPGATALVDKMMEEHWLRPANNTDEDRRQSMSLQLQLGPRTFLELSAVLTDMGVEDLPQFLFHRN